MYVPLTRYHPSDTHTPLDEEDRAPAINSLYVNLQAGDAEEDVHQSKEEETGNRTHKQEESITKMIEDTDANVLKDILISHSRDHRVHLLSYVVGMDAAIAVLITFLIVEFKRVD